MWSMGTRSLRTKYISMLDTKKLSRLNMCAFKNRKTQKLNFTELNNIYIEKNALQVEASLCPHSRCCII